MFNDTNSKVLYIEILFRNLRFDIGMCVFNKLPDRSDERYGNHSYEQN